MPLSTTITPNQVNPVQPSCLPGLDAALIVVGNSRPPRHVTRWTRPSLNGHDNLLQTPTFIYCSALCTVDCRVSNEAGGFNEEGGFSVVREHGSCYSLADGASKLCGLTHVGARDIDGEGGGGGLGAGTRDLLLPDPTPTG